MEREYTHQRHNDHTIDRFKIAGGYSAAAESPLMSRRCVIAVLAIFPLSLFGGPAWAGTNAWTGTGPDGGPVLAVLVDTASLATPSPIYVGTAGSGVFKSLDGGVTWAQTEPGGSLAKRRVRSLVFGAAGTIYAGSDDDFAKNGVFQSTDSGISWQPIGTNARGLTNRKVQALAWDGTSLYAGVREEGAGSGVFKWTGTTWTGIGTSLNGLTNRKVQALAIDPLPVPKVVYAGTQGAGVFKTIDGGATWTGPLGSPNPNQGFSSSCLASPEIMALVVDENIPRSPTPTDATLYAAVGGKVGSSGCATGQGAGFFRFKFPEWDRRMNGMLPLLPTLTLNVYSIVMSGTQIFIGSDQGVFRSTTGSGSWNLMPADPPGGLIGLPVRALGVDPAGMATLYAGTSGRGVFTRLPPNDQPSVQTQLWCGSPPPCAGSSGLTALHAQSAAVGLRGGAKAIFAGLVGGGVITSINNGATWQNTPDPERTARTAFGFAVDPTDQSVVYAATDEGVLVSDNGGDAWTIASAGLPTDASPNVSGPGPLRTVRSILVDPANPLVLYAGVKAGSSPLLPGGVYRSVNGGASWTALNTGLPSAATTDGRSIVSAFAIDRGPGTGAWGTLYAAIAATEGDVCSGSRCGVFKSIDGGASWTLIDEGISLDPDLSFSALAIDPLPPVTVYGGTSTGKVFRFVSGDTRWRAFGTGLPGQAVTALVVKLGAPSTIYAGLDGAGVYSIQGTGSSWTALSANAGLASLNVAGLAFDPRGEGTLYAATLGRGIFDYEFFAGGTTPEVSINAPVPSTSSPIFLSGTASGFQIFKVFWSTNRGHAGVADLTAPNWSTNAMPVPLEPGPNFITVTAVDGNFHQGSATITVTLPEAGPVIAVDPLSVLFGTVPVDSVSARRDVTVSNHGTDDLVLGALAVGGENSDQFKKRALQDSCSGATLAPTTGTCTVGLRFQPTSGGPKSATLSVIPLNAPPVTVALSGTGGGPGITVTPLSLAFGPVPVGSVSGRLNVTVSNPGTENLILGALAVAGVNPGQFKKKAPQDSCSGATLVPMATCTVGLKFKPTSGGPKSATLEIPSNVPPVTVILSGTGQ